MTAKNHSPPARSLRRTQCTNLWVVYHCALSKRRVFRLLPFQQFFQSFLRVLPVKNEFQQQHDIICQAFRLKYKRLSQEEQSLLKKLFKKSPLIKQSGMNFRRRPWK